MGRKRQPAELIRGHAVHRRTEADYMSVLLEAVTLTSLFEMRPIQRTGEAESRLVLMAKIPGRRFRPSDLTKLAKAAGP